MTAGLPGRVYSARVSLTFPLAPRNGSPARCHPNEPPVAWTFILRLAMGTSLFLEDRTFLLLIKTPFERYGLLPEAAASIVNLVAGIATDAGLFRLVAFQASAHRDVRRLKDPRIFGHIAMALLAGNSVGQMLFVAE